jgi:hypothetical protein
MEPLQRASNLHVDYPAKPQESGQELKRSDSTEGD